MPASPETIVADFSPLDAAESAELPVVDRESAAWATSLLLHLSALVLLAVVTLALPRADERLNLAVAPLDLAEPEPLSEEFMSSDVVDEELGALAAGGTDGALAAAPELSDDSLVVHEVDFVADVGERPAVELDTSMFRGPELSTSLAVQGVGAVGTTGADGAIDRLTHEILASLERRPTMVVWLFDQSGSLKAERASVLKRFRRIYDELGVIEAADNPAFRRHKDKPLLTAVVGFGASPTMFTQPTDLFEEIEAGVEAIEEAEVDWYGQAGPQGNRDELRRQLSQENVFQAVGMVAEKFSMYRSARNGHRHVMIVVFTDESGDDIAALDDTVELCRRYAMPVYVVGRPAVFGRQMAYVKWVDPDPNFDQRPQWTPVNLGPESMMPEAVKLWVNVDDEPLLDSGFGPYALTRLCYETGGIYFSAHPNREVGRELSRSQTDNLSVHFSSFFDGEVMKRYQPDYVSIAEYQRLLRTNRARMALVEASRMSWQSQLSMDNVRLRFPKRDEAELAQSLSVAQRSAAVVQPKLTMLCQTLLAAEEERELLDQPRWQAGYDLALGRLMAAKARTDGYNVMLAAVKQGMPFSNESNNTWVLRADDEFADTSLEKISLKARMLLERVVSDHPNTPWALLAERELDNPMGWRWDEDYSPPPRNTGNRMPRPQPPRRDPPPL